MSDDKKPSSNRVRKTLNRQIISRRGERVIAAFGIVFMTSLLVFVAATSPLKQALLYLSVAAVSTVLAVPVLRKLDAHLKRRQK